ncbi:MAG: Type 1 glutamine amidotransferase-like domain-containing protein [Candidatus Jorgensenbacteria bacterium]|nr:Type 1 glutamine amidotransferase-like domain-containing protein [Candidatus Jorgensenbacteria bacterium]
MKLLLTSGGISNQLIAKGLFELVGKPAAETSVAFIPTAANVEVGDKDWLINDLINIKKQGFKSIAIVDISAVPENIWRPQIEEADVLFFEGGNTYHLMRWINTSGLVKILPELLKTKVYVGVSAGSMVTAPDLGLRLSRAIYGDDTEESAMAGLGFVDFYFLPHLNSPYFPARMDATIKEVIKEITKKTYALDDQSALKVVDGKVKVIGGGKYFEFN